MKMRRFAALNSGAEINGDSESSLVLAVGPTEENAPNFATRRPKTSPSILETGIPSGDPLGSGYRQNHEPDFASTAPEVGHILCDEGHVTILGNLLLHVRHPNSNESLTTSN